MFDLHSTSIAHFRVTQSLCYKVKLSAMPLIRKWCFCSLANKTHFHKKGFSLTLLLKVSVFELGNGLSTAQLTPLQLLSLIIVLYWVVKGPFPSLVRWFNVLTPISMLTLYFSFPPWWAAAAEIARWNASNDCSSFGFLPHSSHNSYSIWSDMYILKFKHDWFGLTRKHS